MHILSHTYVLKPVPTHSTSTYKVGGCWVRVYVIWLFTTIYLPKSTKETPLSFTLNYGLFTWRLAAGSLRYLFVSYYLQHTTQQPCPTQPSIYLSLHKKHLYSPLLCKTSSHDVWLQIDWDFCVRSFTTLYLQLTTRRGLLKRGRNLAPSYLWKPRRVLLPHHTEGGTLSGTPAGFN